MVQSLKLCSGGFSLGHAYLQLRSLLRPAILNHPLCALLPQWSSTHSSNWMKDDGKGHTASPGSQSSRMKKKKVALMWLLKKDLKLFAVARRIWFSWVTCWTSLITLCSLSLYIYIQPGHNSSPSPRTSWWDSLILSPSFHPSNCKILFLCVFSFSRLPLMLNITWAHLDKIMG